MDYEVKVILAAVVDILKSSKDLDEAISRVAAIANVEGVIIETEDEKK